MRRKISEIYLSLILITAILIVLNILLARHFTRFDFTKDKEYTLSKATKEIIQNLDAPVTIIAYFSKKLPPNLLNERRRLINTLEDYRTYSHGNIIFKVLDPNSSQEIENQAMRDGIAPVIVEIREKDQAKQQKAFMGIVIKYKNKKDVIQYINPNTSLEFLLTQSIKKITTKNKPEIGILQSFGAPDFSKMQGFINEVSVLYKPKRLIFDSTQNNLLNYKVIAIVSPQDSIPPKFFKYLDQYLQHGGRVFMAVDAVVGHLNSNPPIGNSVKTGISKWLKKYGITLYHKFIIDARCANIQVQQGNFPIPISLPFPYFPIISNFANHPITKGLEGVIMSFASPLEYQKNDSIKFTPLAYTSKMSGVQTPPIFFDTYKKWSNSDFDMHNLIVGGLVEGKAWKMVIFGDGDFLQLPQGERFQRSDNISLAVNSVDYLADDTGLMSLRTKGISYEPLKQLKTSTKVLLKYLNFLLPIILVLIIGLIRSRRNHSKRNKLKKA